MIRLLVICGPTATGKTALALKIAQRFGGELVSADSRQVYRGMDIGTGKDIPRNAKLKAQNAKLQRKSQKFSVGYRVKKRIPVWLVDIIEPEYSFNVADYVQCAIPVIQDIHARERLPIIVGGTGLYIKSLLEPLPTITIPPDQSLRTELEVLDVSQLQHRLKHINAARLAAMNHSDRNNPRRLMRAIEIGRYVQKKQQTRDEAAEQYFNQPHNPLRICLTAPAATLQKRIENRVEKRLQQGILGEIQRLLEAGYSWDLPSMSALGYRQWKELFSGYAPQKQIMHKWKTDEVNFAKRQLRWFCKQPGLHWFDITRAGWEEHVVNLVQRWYTEINFPRSGIPLRGTKS